MNEVESMGETRYSDIPDKYKDEQYEEWFSIDTIRLKYDNDILKACEDHPAYFAYYLLGFKLRDYQLYLIDEMVKNRYLLTLMGRRMGKSTVFKVFDAWALWYNKYPQGRDGTTKVIVLAHTMDSAESYIHEIRDMYECGDKRVLQLGRGRSRWCSLPKLSFQGLRLKLLKKMLPELLRCGFSISFLI